MSSSVKGVASAYAGVASTAHEPLAIDIGMDIDMAIDKGVSAREPSGDDASDAQESGVYGFEGGSDAVAPAVLSLELPTLMLVPEVMGMPMTGSAWREYCRSSSLRPAEPEPGHAADSGATEEDEDAEEMDERAGRGAMGMKAE